MFQKLHRITHIFLLAKNRYTKLMTIKLCIISVKTRIFLSCLWYIILFFIVTEVTRILNARSSNARSKCHSHSRPKYIRKSKCLVVQ